MATISKKKAIEELEHIHSKENLLVLDRRQQELDTG